MNILGINISHDTSISFYKNKKITHLYEESRFNNNKNFAINENESFLIAIDEKLNFKPDIVCYSSYGRLSFFNKFSNDEKIIKLIQKQLNNPSYFFEKNNHHIYHATNAFYFSNFEEAMAIVIDGGGAQDKKYPSYQEIESIFYISKEKIVKKYQHKTNRRFCAITDEIFNYSNYGYKCFTNGTEIEYSSKAVGGMLFNLIGNMLNLTKESGKIMGLASYSKTEKNYNLEKKRIELAQYAQDVTFKQTCNLIEKAYNYKKIKNFILSGGYFLNCSNNFKYVKKYPEINFFVDPNPSDSGTASGVCIYYDHYL